jgi:hypothetical protein
MMICRSGHSHLLGSVHAGVGPQYDLGVVWRHGDRPAVHVGQRPGPDQRPRVLQVTAVVIALLVRAGVPAINSTK